MNGDWIDPSVLDLSRDICFSQHIVAIFHSGFLPGFLLRCEKHVACKLSAGKMIFCVKLSRIVHQK